MQPALSESIRLQNCADLTSSYRATYCLLLKAREAAASHKDKQLLSHMLSDVYFVIEWLQTGRIPGNRRSIERRASYQRVKPVDPSLLARCSKPKQAGYSNPLTDEQSLRLEQALSRLSARERECYELHYATGLSYQEIAAILSLKKGTIQSYMQTAEKKLGGYRSSVSLTNATY